MAFNTDRSNAYKVYSGKPGCMCGCNGKWTYTTSARSDCGYEPTRNDRTVSAVYNKVMAHPNKVVNDEVRYATVDINGRHYVVYFK